MLSISQADLEGIPMWKEGEAVGQDRPGFESCHWAALRLRARRPSLLNLSPVTQGQEHFWFLTAGLRCQQHRSCDHGGPKLSAEAMAVVDLIRSLQQFFLSRSPSHPTCLHVLRVRLSWHPVFSPFTSASQTLEGSHLPGLQWVLLCSPPRTILLAKCFPSSPSSEAWPWPPRSAILSPHLASRWPYLPRPGDGAVSHTWSMRWRWALRPGEAPLTREDRLRTWWALQLGLESRLNRVLDV